MQHNPILRRRPLFWILPAFLCLGLFTACGSDRITRLHEKGAVAGAGVYVVRMKAREKGSQKYSVFKSRVTKLQ